MEIIIIGLFLMFAVVAAAGIKRSDDVLEGRIPDDDPRGDPERAAGFVVLGALLFVAVIAAMCMGAGLGLAR